MEKRSTFHFSLAYSIRARYLKDSLCKGSLVSPRGQLPFRAALPTGDPSKWDSTDEEDDAHEDQVDDDERELI